MKPSIDNLRRSKLYYHPTWYIGKVIEFQDRGTHQKMLVESVQRRYDSQNMDQGYHFVGRFILDGYTTPLVAWAYIKGIWWLCESRRRKRG